MHPGAFIPAAVFLGVGGVSGFIAWRKARRMAYFRGEDLDVSEVKPGVVKLMGTVVEPDEPLTAPLSGARCAFYRVEVQELVGRGAGQRWATIYTEQHFARFALKDRKTAATVRVDMTGAEVVIPNEGGSDDFQQLYRFLESRGQKAWLGRRDLRAAETTITAGEKLYVLGTAQTSPSGELYVSHGEAPFVVSDQDLGQVAYESSTMMYLARFWTGVSGLAGLYWLYRGLR